MLAEEIDANGKVGHSSGTFEWMSMPKGEQCWASDKQVAIVWPNDEREKAWDPAATWCYYDPKS